MWKDPARKTIIPLFDPPEGFSPAATGYLIKMGMNKQIISSALQAAVEEAAGDP